MAVLVGALMFLGCPFGCCSDGGGDLNAVVGLLGFIVGIGGARSREQGFSSSERTRRARWRAGRSRPRCRCC